MERIVSNRFGCQIIERNNKIFIRFDNGQAASIMIEVEITKEEAEKAILSEKDAYEVILQAQIRENRVKNE